LYPFGFGLSYSTFKYSDFNISKTVIKKTDKLNVQVTVTNTSNRDGEEVVQLYIRDYAASIIRPVKELKGFQKIALKAGEGRKVNFTLTAKELSFFDAAGNTVFETGKFAVFVGGNSKEVKQLDFEVK
jgi:beta-glucosidase